MVTAGCCGGGRSAEQSGYGSEAQRASTAGGVSAGWANRLMTTRVACRVAAVERSDWSLQGIWHHRPERGSTFSPSAWSAM